MEIEAQITSIGQWIKERYDQGEICGVSLHGPDNAVVPKGAARLDYEVWRLMKGITMPCTEEVFSKALNAVPGKRCVGVMRRRITGGREWCFVLRPALPPL